MNEQHLNNLAELAVKTGVNLQPGQKLVINTPIEAVDFARRIAAIAFAAGAKDVRMNYNDEKFTKIRYDHGELEIFQSLPQWLIDRQMSVVEEGYAIISIYADDPDLLKDVDPEKIKAATQASHQALAAYQRAVMNNENRWLVISVPTLGWARKVYPGVDDAVAMEQLWEDIFKATRADQDDPVAAWQAHNENFAAKEKYLNEMKFDRFIYRNDSGTNLTVGMPAGYIFSGGSEIAADGVPFFPNMPTEEVFSAPHKDRVDGTVAASYPLVYNGQVIDKFSLTFKDGKVVDFDAEVGKDVLEALLTTSENADRLGEIALVPYHSPISDMNLLFYNTLFDENASCHFALGAAYPMCLEGGTKMSTEELQAHGLNYSTTHEDFMVGTEDLSIIGVTKEGEEVAIFVDGDWAF